jgi:hypothetical protein
MRYLKLFFVIAAMVVASSAFAKNERRVVFSGAITQDDGAVTLATISNPYSTSAYVVITVASEVGTASFAATIVNQHTLATATTVCTTTAQTAASHHRALIGTNMTVAEGVTQACKMPLAALVQIVGTIADDAGPAADGFTVTVEWLPLVTVSN